MAAAPRTLGGDALPYTVAATYVLEYLTTTIIATALPRTAETLAVEPDAVSLGMSAYMPTLAGLHPGQRLGRRPIPLFEPRKDAKRELAR